MTFSRAISLEHDLETKIYRAKTMAKQGHPDFKSKHPGEARDANQKQFTVLVKRIKEEHEKYQTEFKRRKNKLVQ